jgi:hypothetical protein
MKLKIIILSIVFSFIPVSANAIYSGESANGDQLIVSTFQNGCSTAMIAPRILAMAQHCSPVIGSTRYAYPGLHKFSDKTARVIATFIPTGNFLGGREYDIMLVVIDQDFPVSTKLKIATEQDINRWKINQTPISVYGYGQTKLDTWSDTANKASFYISSLPDLGNGISSSYTSVLSLNPSNGTSQVCNGDSGGPSYVFENNQIYFIGVNISSNKMNGCGSDSNSTTFARVQTLYPFMDLLTQANDWIEKNTPKPVIDIVIPPVKTIVCKKFLITKKIKGTNPKCPKGYKIVK